MSERFNPLGSSYLDSSSDSSYLDPSLDSSLDAFLNLVEICEDESEIQVRQSLLNLQVQLTPGLDPAIYTEFDELKKAIVTEVALGYQTCKLTNILVKDIKKANRQDGIIVPLLLLLIFSMLTLASANTLVMETLSQEHQKITEQSSCQLTSQDLAGTYPDLNKITGEFCKRQHKLAQTHTVEVEFNGEQFTAYESFPVSNSTTGQGIKSDDLTRFHQYWGTNAKSCFGETLNPLRLQTLMQSRLDVYNAEMSDNQALTSPLTGDLSKIAQGRVGENNVFDKDKPRKAFDYVKNDRAAAQEHLEQIIANEANSGQIATISSSTNSENQDNLENLNAITQIIREVFEFHASVTCKISTKNIRAITCTFTVVAGVSNLKNSQHLLQNFKTHLILKSGITGYDAANPHKTMMALATQTSKNSSDLTNTQSIVMLDNEQKLSFIFDSVTQSPFFIQKLMQRGFSSVLVSKDFYHSFLKDTKTYLRTDNLPKLTHFLPVTVQDLKDSEAYKMIIDQANQPEEVKQFLSLVAYFWGTVAQSDETKKIIELIRGTFFNITNSTEHFIKTGLETFDKLVDTGSKLMTDAGALAAWGTLLFGKSMIFICITSATLYLLFPAFFSVALRNKTYEFAVNKLTRDDEIHHLEHSNKMRQLQHTLIANPQITSGNVNQDTQTSTDVTNPNDVPLTPNLKKKSPDAINQADNPPEREEISKPDAKAMIQATGAGKRNNFFKTSVFGGVNEEETGPLSIARTANEIKGIEVGDIVSGNGKNYKLYEGRFFFGGAKTRKHKKRIGGASKHHKKRRRGTKKPSKKRRATRRKRR